MSLKESLRPPKYFPYLLWHPWIFSITILVRQDLICWLDSVNTIMVILPSKFVRTSLDWKGFSKNLSLRILVYLIPHFFCVSCMRTRAHEVSKAGIVIHGIHYYDRVLFNTGLVPLKLGYRCISSIHLCLVIYSSKSMYQLA